MASFGFDESQLRRAAPRQFTAWRGRFLLDGESAHSWRECQVVDVSATGAGLLLAGVTPVQVRGRRMVLSLQLPATIMNVVDDAGGVRVGTQFLEISAEERDEMRKMSHMGVRW